MQLLGLALSSNLPIYINSWLAFGIGRVRTFMMRRTLRSAGSTWTAIAALTSDPSTGTGAFSAQASCAQNLAHVVPLSFLVWREPSCRSALELEDAHSR